MSLSSGQCDDQVIRLSMMDMDSNDEVEKEAIPMLRFGFICLGVALGLFLAMLDTSIVATSLYSIGTEFNDLRNVNWVALAYTLTYMGFSVVFSRVSDITGRRDAFSGAYIVFVAFSIACGFSQNLHQLIAFRVVQGIGGSGLYSLTMVMLPEISPKHLKQKIASLVGLVIAVSGVLGPVMGGLLTSYTTWRWVFWINGPVGGVSLVIFLLSWPDPKYLPVLKKRYWKEMDYPGSFLTIAATVLVVFSFQNAGQSSNPSSKGINNWSSAIFIAPLVAGLLCWAALILWQYAVQHYFSKRIMPVLPLQIFKNHVYTSGVLNTLILGFPYLLLIYIVPLRIQVVGGKSALMGGVMLVPMLGTLALGTVISGVINSKRKSITETLVIGSCLMMLGCALLTTLSTHELETGKLLGFIVFCGLGFGLTAASSTIMTEVEIPSVDYAPAQGILAQVRIFGGSLGIAASTAILRSGVGDVSFISSKRDSSSSTSQDQFTRSAYGEAFRKDAIVATVISSVAVILSLITWLFRHRLHSRASMQQEV